jgi:hypothetical protein
MVKNFVRTYTNMITPPDFITSKDQHSILLIDAEQSEVMQVTSLCKNVDFVFDIYLYHAGMNNEAWLEQVAQYVDHIIVNTVSTECSTIKERLATKGNASYYGPRSPLGNPNQIETPLVYFIKYVNDRTSSTAQL